MVKAPGAEHASTCTQLTVQTASNGTEYALFKLREGNKPLPDGVVDMRPTRTKCFFADQVDLSLIVPGATLALSREDWDEDSGSDETEDAPF